MEGDIYADISDALSGGGGGGMGVVGGATAPVVGDHGSRADPATSSTPPPPPPLPASQQHPSRNHAGGSAWEASRRQEEAMQVAEYLLREKHLLTALELHQELMEAAGGMHNIKPLNDFFGNPDHIESVMADESMNPAVSQALPALSAVPSPYDPYNTQDVVEDRDQQIALLAYKLRLADEDKATLEAQISEGVAAGEFAVEGAPTEIRPRVPSVTLDDDDTSDLGEMTEHERRAINCLVKQYLVSAGYKLTAVTFSDEATGQDLDALAAVGLHGRSASVLALYRDRVAPLHDFEDLKRDLAAAQAENERYKQEASERKAEIRRLKDELEIAQNKTAAAVRARAAALQSLETITKDANELRDEYPAGRDGASAHPDHNVTDALATTMAQSLPSLVPHFVTKQRITLLPVFAAVVAAHPAADTRRGLMSQMLTLVKKPTSADRAVIVKQIRDLALVVGGARCEQELMPQVLAMATHKAKERRAVAAEACGVLGEFVSDKRCDSLLATLTMLADDDHTVVRCAVATGVATLARTLSASASPSSSESRRQYAEVEDLMWRALLEGCDAQTQLGREHGAILDTDDIELWGHHMAGGPNVEAASKGDDPPSSSHTLPASLVPDDDANVVFAVLEGALPVVARWARRLGWLWSRLIPQVLSILRDTLSSPAPDGSGSVHSGSRSVSSRFSTDVDSPALYNHLTLWHQNRCAALMTALQRLSPMLAFTMLEEGVTVTSRVPHASEGRQSTGNTETDSAKDKHVEGTKDGEDPKREVSHEGTQDDADADATDATADAGQAEGADSGTSRIYRIGGNAEPADKAAGEYGIAEGIALFGHLPANDEPDAPNAPAVPTSDGGQSGAGASAGGRPRSDTAAAEHSAHYNASASSFASILAGRAYLEQALLPGHSRTPSTPTASKQNWTRVPWSDVPGLVVEWEGLKCLLHDYVPQLLEDATHLDRGSSVGRIITDQYAAGLRRLCCVLGTHFVAHAVRPLFKRALGLSLRGSSGAVSPHDAAATRDHTLLIKILAGAAPPSLGSSSRLAQQSKGTFDADDEGDGLDWVSSIPALDWLGIGDESTRGGSAAGSGGGGGGASVNGIDGAASVASGSEGAWGAAWRAEPLLPLFATAVLSCPCLPVAHLRTALRELVVRVAQKSDSWGITQSLVEAAFVRVGQHKAVLPAVLSLLQRVATNPEESARASVAGLLQSLVPALSKKQLESPVLPSLLSLSEDSSPVVVKAAVRALTSLYLQVSDPSSLVRVNTEVAKLLERGPKEVVLDVLRAIMRGIPRADPSLRDGFMLDQVLNVASRLEEAANAGVQEYQDMVAAIGDVGGDEQSAAEQAAFAAREAAVQLHAPWNGAKLDDLEEAAMATLECMRSFGTCLLADTTKQRLVRGVRQLLFEADVVDPSYRDMMVATLSGMGLPIVDESEAGAPDPMGSPLVPSPSGASDGRTSTSGGGYDPSSPKSVSTPHHTPSRGAGGPGGYGRTPSNDGAASGTNDSGHGDGIVSMSLSSFSAAGAAAPPKSPEPSGSSSILASPEGSADKSKFGSKMFGKIKGIKARAKARMTRKKTDSPADEADD